MKIDKTLLLQRAIYLYGLNANSLTIEQELQSYNQHGDIHFQIRINHQSYSARLIGNKRYETDVFIGLSDEIVHEQIRFCSYLVDAGIPFMKHIETQYGEPFIRFHFADQEWRFILFEWLEGEHITHGTERIAYTFGEFARNIHRVSAQFESTIFSQSSHLQGYDQFYHLLHTPVEMATLMLSTKELLRSYFKQVEYHLQCAKADSFNFIVQSDLNPLNVLWNSDQQVIGLVDFESITYTDRLEALAWLIKWYSRTEGVISHQMSPVLTEALLQGYGADKILTSVDWQRLPSLIWLTGCLNWNFISRTIELIGNEQETLLQQHLSTSIKRGEQLLSLIR
ncbi:phosphotransferase enzyme family protein [Paenibacillus wenxiniae]|uniref:Phosphotransferase enzyme family protein n=1 Tax=Paenibacillus wenxiniae TaxID=1636843 RepID=A0ABW4RPL6_9BACL